MSWLRNLVLSLLGLKDVWEHVRDLERHFVTKRDAENRVVETLADVPLDERERRRKALKGLSWQQQQQWLERTDGGRLSAANPAPTTKPKSRKRS